MDQFQVSVRGDLQQLHLLLTTNNVNDVNSAGDTVLHNSASFGYLECVNFCLEMGANVNARSNFRSTPLHFASLYGNFDVVRILLDAGATIDVTDNHGWTPLYCAIRFNRVNVARLLIDRGGKISNEALRKFVPTFPDWLDIFLKVRTNCRSAATIIVGIHKYRRTSITGNNDINVLRLIGKHVWSTRMEDVWSQPQ
jgi:ankyrin repeat protein